MGRKNKLTLADTKWAGFSPLISNVFSMGRFSKMSLCSGLSSCTDILQFKQKFIHILHIVYWRAHNLVLCMKMYVEHHVFNSFKVHKVPLTISKFFSAKEISVWYQYVKSWVKLIPRTNEQFPLHCCIRCMWDPL